MRGRKKYKRNDNKLFLHNRIHLQKVLQKSTCKSQLFLISGFLSYIANDLSCTSKQNKTLIVKANSLYDVEGIFIFSVLDFDHCVNTKNEM